MDELISRQAAIEELRKMAIALYRYDATSVISCAIHKLQNLPSAKQNKTCEFWDSESSFCALNRPSAQRKGKWIRNNDSDHTWKCSVCGCGYTDFRLNYCYDCGAEMVKGEQDVE